MITYHPPRYGRNDVDFESWYSAWAKRIALQYTAAELRNLLNGANNQSQRAAHSHLRAIQRTNSMSSCAQRRAQARNVTAAAGDYALAICAALEIHELFPEHAKKEN